MDFLSFVIMVCATTGPTSSQCTDVYLECVDKAIEERVIDKPITFCTESLAKATKARLKRNQQYPDLRDIKHLGVIN